MKATLEIHYATGQQIWHFSKKRREKPKTLGNTRFLRLLRFCFSWLLNFNAHLGKKPPRAVQHVLPLLLCIQRCYVNIVLFFADELRLPPPLCFPLFTIFLPKSSAQMWVYAWGLLKAKKCVECSGLSYIRLLDFWTARELAKHTRKSHCFGSKLSGSAFWPDTPKSPLSHLSAFSASSTLLLSHTKKNPWHVVCFTDELLLPLSFPAQKSGKKCTLFSAHPKEHKKFSTQQATAHSFRDYLRAKTGCAKKIEIPVRGTCTWYLSLLPFRHSIFCLQAQAFSLSWSTRRKYGEVSLRFPNFCFGGRRRRRLRGPLVGVEAQALSPEGLILFSCP